jgi:AcrR family transcriptional regulator
MTSPQEPQPTAETPDVPRPAPESTAPTAPGAVAIRGAACLLGAGCVVWATVPSVPKGFADFALFLAILGVAAGALRLALAAVPVPEDNYLLPTPLRAWLRFLETLRLVPWEELALIAILWLEVLHPSRPWHTAVLGAALIGYLLATHLAETDASPGALRPQVRVLAAGAALLALGAGAGMLPASGPGAGSALLRLVAAGALIAAAGLVLPYVARGDTPPPPPG